MHTVTDARKLWCPFARVADNGFATNRHAGEKTGRDGKPRILRGNSMCIATECSAWRWVPKNDLDPHDVRWGYCGLAGKP